MEQTSMCPVLREFSFREGLHKPEGDARVSSRAESKPPDSTELAQPDPCAVESVQSAATLGTALKIHAVRQQHC